MIRRSRTAVVLVSVLLVGLLGLAACGSSKKATPSANAGNRPTTTATLEIVAPQANATTGPNVTLQMKLNGGEVVPPTQTSGPLTGDKGHIHVSVDGQLVSMNYTTTAQLTGLKPGVHGVQAEFVAIDHVPFKNRVMTTVIFTVAPPQP